MDTQILVLAAVLIAIQLTLQITALVQLVRTPADRITIGGRKWAWAIIILLGEIIGPIIWFVAGRKPAAATGTVQAPEAAERQAAVDSLYGPSGD